MNNIVINNFDLYADCQKSSTKLLSDTRLKIIDGKKYGLIGVNGCGKTTLLKQIYKIYKDYNAFLVEQEFMYQDTDTVYQIVESANQQISQLVKTRNELEKNNGDNFDEQKLVEIYDELNFLKIDAQESIIKSILIGMGFRTCDFDRSVNDFSGGWKMRINLARALYMKPSILLLDEPSNHLDLNAMIWLTDYLSNSYLNTVIIISHDKNLLNCVCDEIILIEKKTLNYFSGNYDEYQKKYAKIMELNSKEYSKKNRELMLLKKNNKIDTTQKNKKIAQLNLDLNRLAPNNIRKCRYNFADVEFYPGEPIMKLSDISFSYETGQKIFQNLNFEINTGQKIIIVGKNGIGKSTFFDIILGNKSHETLFDGQIIYYKKIRIGYYSQESHLTLNFDMSAVEYLMKMEYRENIAELNKREITSRYNKDNTQLIGEFFCRKSLGDVGLPSDHHLKLISNLSGGQKSRVAFAKLFVEKPHLILLDEPTNHLDIDSIDSLIENINQWNGTIIIITHNIHLIRNIDAEIFEIDNHKITKTTFNDYSQKITNLP